jgi:hypothetical protein
MMQLKGSKSPWRCTNARISSTLAYKRAARPRAVCFKEIPIIKKVNEHDK